jgi:hypothetical protein
VAGDPPGRAYLFRIRKDGAFPPISLAALLPFGDSRDARFSSAAFCDCRGYRSLIQF